MPSIDTLAYWEGFILLGGFFGLVFWKLLNGGISLHGLLQGQVRDKSQPSGFSKQFSPGRAQALMVTLLFAMNYLIQVINNPTEFPPVPNAMLAVLGGSHALYLGGKAKNLLLGNLKDVLK
jgi:hypothetical protein